jgi:beta-lactamase class A
MRKNVFRRSGSVAAALLGASLLAACAQTDVPVAQVTVVAEVAQATAAPAASPTAAAPTAAATEAPTVLPPTATPTVWMFPDESTVADVDVGGLTEEEATSRVADALEQLDRRITLRAPRYLKTLRAVEFLELPEADELVADARAAVEGDESVEQPLDASVDEDALRTFVEGMAPALDQPLVTKVISDAKALTQTFTFAETPGEKLDIDQAISDIEAALQNPESSDSIDLPLETTKATRPPMAELERVLREHANFWDGIAAFYVQDLETGESIAINADTVFSGASVMKVPIMIFVYSRLGELNEQQTAWMEKVIIDSENIEANSLLAAAVGGEGTESALEGVNEMSLMLEDLGLEHTYQLIPYESGEWLIQQSRLPAGGPPQEGQEPFTAPDPYVRTTPREMGSLFVMLHECSEGKGTLLEKVGGKLTADLCKEMIAWLQRPHDEERMVAGLPAGTLVAHKGGWIDDMQSDVGIVDSPGGRYVAAIYIWTNGYVTNEHATPSPYLGDFSHTIYTFFNPTPLDEVPPPTEADEPE